MISNAYTDSGATSGADDAPASVAARVVEAAARGHAPEADDLQQLADLVLTHPDVRAALEIRAGGPWALTRALELAERVLRRHDEAEDVVKEQ